MIVSFNSHYQDPDIEWPGPLPLDPKRAFDAAFKFMAKLKLDKSVVHTLVAPGVREGCIIAAYHTLMGHFPYVLYSIREGDKWIWLQANLQDWRDKYRHQR
mgnify:CR=1 FL=1